MVIAARTPLARLTSAAVLLLAIASCSSTSGGPADTTPTDSNRTDGPRELGAVCPSCSQVGGETSDFGAGPVGPTECEKSEARSALDEAAARALGFGDALDTFEHSVSLPFEWTYDEVTETPWREPTGYAKVTTIDLETRIAGIDHLVPSLAGCEERLEVKIDASFRTQDDGISTAFQLVASAKRQRPPQRAYGQTDLTTVTGTLRLSTVGDLAKTIGHFQTMLYFWPDTVRGWVRISLTWYERDSDERSAGSWWPMQGRFPLDHCDLQDPLRRPLQGRPLQANTRSTVLGKSPNEVRAEVAALLDARSPAPGRWTDGTETSVTMKVGAPSRVCEAGHWLEFDVPVMISTDDGRVNIDESALGSVSLDANGTVVRVTLELGSDSPLPAQSFASNTGISGLDLSMYLQVFWHSEIYLLGEPPPATPDLEPHGSLTVKEARDRSIVGNVAELTWSFAPL
jgi:hypothetical protein